MRKVKLQANPKHSAAIGPSKEMTKEIINKSSKKSSFFIKKKKNAK